MGQLNARRTYASLEVPLESDIDLFLNDIETFLNITKLNNDNIQDASITASTKLSPLSITTSKFKNVSVTTAKIADGNITTAKIEDDAITAAKILDSNITTAKILDSNVTTAKIADLNITTAKILDASVTNIKLSLNYQVSSDSGIYEIISGDEDITNCSVSITTTGYPVLIAAIPGTTGDDSSISVGGVTSISSYINIKRDSTTLFREPIIASNTYGSSSGFALPPSMIFYIDDTPGAGTYTYKLNAIRIAGGLYINHIRLFVMELVR
jgi:hypothetical protein